MATERRVKLFKIGQSQAVRIPRAFELPGEDAIMRKDGGRLIIEPTPPKSLLALLATLAPLKEDFPPIPDPAPDPVEILMRDRRWRRVESPDPAGPLKGAGFHRTTEFRQACGDLLRSERPASPRRRR